MSDKNRCAGSHCPKRENCTKFRRHWNGPLATLHWWGIAAGSCRHFEAKNADMVGRDTIEAMLKHSRKILKQRENAPLAKHGNETFKGAT